MGFPTVYGKTVLHKQQVLAILVPGTNFRTGQEVGRAGKIFSY